MPFGFYYKYIAISFVFIVQLLNNIHPPTKIHTPFGRNKHPSQKFPPPPRKKIHALFRRKKKQTNKNPQTFSDPSLKKKTSASEEFVVADDETFAAKVGATL